jgi:hypothetical protein
MRIVNCTPHEINIYSDDSLDLSNPRRVYLKSPDQSPVLVIPPSGLVLNATITESAIDNYAPLGVLPSLNIFCTSSFAGIELPHVVDAQYTESDLFIVSALYKSAALELGYKLNMATVHGVIYQSEDNPRPIGCRKLNLSLIA